MSQNRTNSEEVAKICSLAESGNFEDLSRLATAENCSQARFDGMTPLMCAAMAKNSPQGKHAACASILLTLAKDAEDRARMTNASNLYGLTSLHYAAGVNNLMVAEKLLVAGGEVNKVNKRGLSALAVAVQQKNTQIVDFLMRVGADAELKDSQSCSPMNLAKDEPKMVKRMKKWLPTLEISPDFQVVKVGKKRDTEGRFADIYDIETKPPNLNIVLRVLTRFPGDAENVLENERRGLEALKMAHHVNIAQLIRFEESNTEIKVYLEDVDGRTIEALLNSDGPFVEVVIQKYFRQLVSALCYLHNHPRGPIIHRDINCRNIMLARDGTIKLIDFGFSLPDGSVCSSVSTITGTICNMSPEIVESDEHPRFSRKSDVWAAGCVLYAMAVGAEPFKAGSMAASVRKICLEPLPQPDKDKFSTSMLALYNSCMRRKTNERISIVEVALHEFLNWDCQHDLDLLAVEKIREWARHGVAAIKALDDITKNINKSHRSEVTAKIGSTAAAVAGGITAIVGFALLIPSFGAALPLVIAGTSVAIAGGVGSATADIAGIIVQRKEIKKSQETINEFKILTQALVLDTLKKIVADVQQQVMKPKSAIQLEDTKLLIIYLHTEIKTIKSTMEKSEIAQNLPEAKGQLKDMFDSWMNPISNLMLQLEDTQSLMSGIVIDKGASNVFNRALLKAIDFIVRVQRILIFGSPNEPSELYVAQLKGSLRLAVGGSQLGLEIGSAAGRTVLGRIFGIVGSAVFTAVDIGLLAYYSVQLHRATNGGFNAEKADPIICQRDIFGKLLKEAEDLDIEIHD